MNFLLHHHLAARDLGTPAAAVGAMLPDLWRMADRRVRPLRERASEAKGELSEVQAGIAHHLVADRWFHRDPVFLEGEERTAIRLREAAIDAPRIVLFAHILWELCLDGELLRRAGVGPVLDTLREGFASAHDAAGEAASIHHWDRVERPEAERELFDRRMDRLFEEIARGPWIDGYQTGEGVAFRIQGVRARLNLPPMAIEAHAALADVADALLDDAAPAVDRILAAPLTSSG